MNYKCAYYVYKGRFTSTCAPPSDCIIKRYFKYLCWNWWKFIFKIKSDSEKWGKQLGHIIINWCTCLNECKWHHFLLRNPFVTVWHNKVSIRTEIKEPKMPEQIYPPYSKVIVKPFWCLSIEWCDLSQRQQIFPRNLPSDRKTLAFMLDNWIMFCWMGTEKWSRWRWPFEIIKSDKLDLRFSKLPHPAVGSKFYTVFAKVPWKSKLVTGLFFLAPGHQHISLFSRSGKSCHFFYTLSAKYSLAVPLNRSTLMSKHVARNTLHWIPVLDGQRDRHDEKCSRQRTGIEREREQRDMNVIKYLINPITGQQTNLTKRRPRNSCLATISFIDISLPRILSYKTTEAQQWWA